MLGDRLAGLHGVWQRLFVGVVAAQLASNLRASSDGVPGPAL
jgi:hypothetical protein